MSDEREAPIRVTVVDVSMPFWSMVDFMVRWVLASIPAMLILAMVAYLIVIAAATLMIGPVGF